MRLHLRPPRRITSIWRTARPPQTPIRGAVLREPWQIGVLMLAVVMLTIQAFVINRAAGIEDPFWDPMQRPATPAGRTSPRAAHIFTGETQAEQPAET